MTNKLLTPDMVEKIHQALRETWSEKTQPAFYSEIPSYNQCAQTAIVICEHFGGEILKTMVGICDEVTSMTHFYNRINGQRYDFTEDQLNLEHFVKPINYQDILSNIQEAQSTLQGFQLEAMRNGFSLHFNS